MTHKTCSKCHESKPVTEFHRNSSTKDGLQYQCKACAREYQREYKEKNRAWVREYNRRWRLQNPNRRI